MYDINSMEMNPMVEKVSTKIAYNLIVKKGGKLIEIIVFTKKKSMLENT